MTRECHIVGHNDGLNDGLSICSESILMSNSNQCLDTVGTLSLLSSRYVE